MVTKKGFTIIELLVVIVVIGILASVIIVSYSNVSSRGTVASIQSDLTNAKKQLLNFQTQSPTSAFPTKNNCPTPGATEICLKSSNNYIFNYVPLNNGVSSSFYLSETDNTANTYIITENTNPTLQSSIISSGLILHLDAGNTSSYQSPNSIWNDMSGNGYNGTLANSPTFDSAGGGSLLFNGTNSYITLNSIPAINSLTKNFTVEAVVRFNTSGGQYGIFSKGGSVWTSWAVYLRQGPQFAFLGQSTDAVSTTVIATPSAQVSNNVWYHLVFTYDGSNLNGYINTEQKAQLLNWGKTFSSSGTSNYVGYDSGITAPQYFPGNISIVRLYNRALSQSEIYQNYITIKVRYALP